MMKLKVQFDTNIIKKRVEEIHKLIQEEATELTYEVAQDILDNAKSRCPIDTGELKDSAYMKKTETGYEVGFSAEHANIAHEQPQSIRKNGESRFLASAVYDVIGEHGEKLKKRVAEDIKKGL